MSSEYLRDLTDYVTALSSLTPLMKAIIHNLSRPTVYKLMEQSKNNGTLNARCNQGRTAMNYAKRKGDQLTYERLERVGGLDLDENSYLEQNPSDDGAAARSDSNLRPQLPNSLCPCFEDPEMQKLLSASEYIPGVFSHTSNMIMMYLSRCPHGFNNLLTGNTSTSTGGTDNISQGQGGSPAGDDNINQGPCKIL